MDTQTEHEDVNLGTQEDDQKLDIIIEDDTPPEDRQRDPMPEDIVQELEADELDQYDGKVKERLKQLKKVYHDERRAKEAAQREHQEAVRYAKQVRDENQRVRELLTQGGQEYATSIQHSAALELEKAKDAFKAAYDSGDADQLVEAQTALNEAQFKLQHAKNFKVPALQQPESELQTQQDPATREPVQVDQEAVAWQKRNTWFGQDEEMTAAALGLHEKLRRTGVVVGSKEYYATLDKTIRKRFPEQFEVESSQPRKSNTIVAPATRSTSPNRVRLTASQVTLAKRLGLTPEQYAREMIELERQNG